MEVYLIRHGQSQDASEGRGQSIHTPLSEIGQLQAEKLHYKLADVKFSKAYSSHQMRAKQTAEYANVASIVVTDFLHEYHRPDWLMDRSKSEREAFWMTQKENLEDWDFAPAGGESFNQYRIRVEKLKQLLSNHADDDNVAVFTHGGFIRLFFGFTVLEKQFNPKLFGLLLENMSISNSAYMHLEYNKQTETSRLKGLYR